MRRTCRAPGDKRDVVFAQPRVAQMLTTPREAKSTAFRKTAGGQSGEPVVSLRKRASKLQRSSACSRKYSDARSNVRERSCAARFTSSSRGLVSIRLRRSLDSRRGRRRHAHSLAAQTRRPVPSFASATRHRVTCRTESLGAVALHSPSLIPILVPSDPARRPDWAGIALFYSIACAITWPLLAWRDFAPDSWAASPIPLWLRPLLYGWGPGLAALLVLRLRAARHERTITLLGTSAVRSLAAVLGPILLVAAVAPAQTAARPHFAGLVAGIHAVVYAFGEELGWRGYLQDALRPLAPLPRYGTLGLLWGLWHLAGFAGHGSLLSMAGRLALFYVILMASSAGIGTAVDRTRSLLVATACHLFFTFTEISTGRDRQLLLGALIPMVVFLVHFWPRSAASVETAGPRAQSIDA